MHAIEVHLTAQPPEVTVFGWTKNRRRTALLSTMGLAAASAGLVGAGGGTVHAAGLVPTPDHTVVVVMENHSYSEIIGSSSAPYINNTLKAGGANLTQSFAVTHPSQPNYYDLLSGNNQGITNDNCITPQFSSAANLGSEVIASGGTWLSYNESLPSQGSTTCKSGKYAQKHNPWFGFSNVPLSTAETFAQFPTDFTTLPRVSFVTPNLCSDMHDCSISTGDTWLKNNIGAYATWAKTHNSVLVVTWDEDDSSQSNQIPTLFYGQPVTAGSTTSTHYNHYNVLRTLEDLANDGGRHAGNAASASDITGIWN